MEDRFPEAERVALLGNRCLAETVLGLSATIARISVQRRTLAPYYV